MPTIGEEEIEAVTAVLRSGRTTMGEKVEEFEAAFAQRVGVPHAVMVNSGSSADLLIAWAAGEPGEVIVPAVTWPTHVWAWEMAGWSVKFCDVGLLNTTPELVKRKLTPKTKAISIPHLMGVPVDMDPLYALAAHHDLIVTEDCCEALGSTDWSGRSVGHGADAAAWSFFFSHHMTTMEGGMVTTHNTMLVDKIKSLRSHGWTRHKDDRPYAFEGPGFNLRPIEVQAAIGLVQLSRLTEFMRWRYTNYGAFEAVLGEHPEIRLVNRPLGASMFGIPMFTKHRDKLADWLEENGVETRPILAGNLRNQEAFRTFYFGKTPGADYLDEHGLFIGLHPTPDSGIEQVAHLIGDFL
jgi:CDP-6-deoxy-D-xylo-4-hexulose-3-dehydrase